MKLKIVLMKSISILMKSILVLMKSNIDAPTHENAVLVAAGTDAILSVSTLVIDNIFNLLVVRNDGGVPARIQLIIDN